MTRAIRRRAEAGLEPGSRADGVGQGLGGGEGLGGDDEQGRVRVEARQYGVQIGRVDVGDEMQARTGLVKLAQRPREHPRAQVRSADADVDDVADARVAVHLADEAPHALARLPHLGRGLARAQRDVQRRPPLGVVDRVPGEHPLDPFRDLRLRGELDEQAHRVGTDSVLGVVEEQAAGLEREALGARGVRREEIADRRSGGLLLVRGERLPRGRTDEGAHDCAATFWYSR
jgi:hypothetical protein